jgi:hypothetical protein
MNQWCTVSGAKDGLLNYGDRISTPERRSDFGAVRYTRFSGQQMKPLAEPQRGPSCLVWHCERIHTRGSTCRCLPQCLEDWSLVRTISSVVRTDTLTRSFNTHPGAMDHPPLCGIRSGTLAVIGRIGQMAQQSGIVSKLLHQFQNQRKNPSAAVRFLVRGEAYR